MFKITFCIQCKFKKKKMLIDIDLNIIYYILVKKIINILLLLIYLFQYKYIFFKIIWITYIKNYLKTITV